MQRKFIVLLVLIFMLSLSLFAGTTGKLAGRVKDSDGNPVAFANIRVMDGTSVVTGAQAKENGSFIIINIPPGTYDVLVSQVGFRNAQIAGVVINVDETTVQNITLSIAKVEIEGYEVTEAKVEMVNRAKTGSSTTITSEAIADVAVDDVEGLLALQSGVNVGEDGEIHVRGGRSEEVSYTVDGVSVSDPVDGASPLSLDTDAIADMQVMTGGLTAEYGNAQSGMINIVTKSGGREYEGKIEYKQDHLFGDRIDNSNLDEVKFAVGGPMLTPMVASLRDSFTFYFNCAANWSDSRYKDYYVSNPDAEIINPNTETTSLTTPGYSESNPYAGRDNILGIDLGSRNFNNYNANFKTKYVFNARQNVTLAVRGDRSELSPYSHSWKYALDHYSYIENQTMQYIATYDHMLTSQMNLKLKASMFSKKNVSGPKGIDRNSYFTKNDAAFNPLEANDLGGCTGINYLTADGYLYGDTGLLEWMVTDPTGEPDAVPFVRPGAISPSYSDDSNETFTLRSDLEYQYNEIHGFKTGFELIRHNIKKNRISSPWVLYGLRYQDYLDTVTPMYWFYNLKDVTDSLTLATYVDEYNLIKKDDSEDSYIYYTSDSTAVKPLNEYANSVTYNLDDYYAATLAASGLTDGYEANPWQGSYYLQDKMEWEGLVVNAGMRFDGWYLGDKYKIFKNNGIEWNHFDDKDKFRLMVSPRLGVSHPISEKSALHFAYNYQNQLPQMQYIFTTFKPKDAVATDQVVIVGNPNLEPQVTVTYEVGLQRQLSDIYVLNVQAFYKNIYNYVSTKKVYDDTLDASYYKYVSEDYGSVRGIDLKVERYLSNFVAGTVAYSLTWANGNSSGLVIQDEMTNLREFRLNWDVRHNASANITFKIGKGEEFFVPFTDYVLPLDDFSINLAYNVLSGRPYTPTNYKGEQLEINSKSYPFTDNANLKITKNFALNNKMKLKAYMQISNLFNKKNVAYVYSLTGSPTDNGSYIYDSENEYYVNAKTGDFVNDNKVYIDQMYYNDPSNFSQGREITVGMSLNF